MSDDFQTVKDALDLRRVITDQTGFEVNTSGHLKECPFCNGHDCFSIPKGGKYHGSYRCHQCDRGGDVFTFLEELHSLDRAGSLKMAAEIAGIDLEKKKGRAPQLTPIDKIRIAAAEYYHGLAFSDEGRSFFIERRGHSEATLKQEMVGMSDGHLLDHLKGKGFSEKEMLESGLVREREIGGKLVVTDFFSKGLAIFPHYGGKRVLHFTQKDPRDVPKDQKLKYQLPNEKKDKRWTFYGQDALDRYDEITLVEGENDRLQVLNAGPFGVVAMIGQISEEQIKVLARRCRGKKLYIWVDNDAAGAKYIRKICKGIPEITVRVVVYGAAGDDPDSYLKAFEGDRRREVRRLQLDALDPISWEIAEAAKLPDLERKLLALKEHQVFQAISRQPAIQQDVFRQKLEALGFSERAITQQLDFSQDLYQQISDYFKLLDNPKDADPISLGEIIFKFFSHHGRFYFDRENRVWLIYQNRTYEIANEVAFNALMLKMTRMIYSKAPGAQVWDALKHIAYLNGRQIDRCQWIFQDVARDLIFMNLNSPGNQILRISKDRVEEIQNGMNDDHILLSSSQKIAPMTFRPDVDIQEAMTALRELVFDNLATEKKQRYLILSWFFSGFCPDLAPYQFLLKFGGYASSGKSTAAKMLTGLVYGNEQLSDPSGAAAFSSASQNPMLVIDNLENKDLTRGMQKFLLLAATRGQKEKRKGGSDTDTVDESPRALICVTAIEPFTLSELISRTFEIGFDRRVHGSDEFHESEVLEQLKKKRDLILSGIIRFIQREILPELEKRKDFMTILNRQFKGHAKDRTNAYLALLMLILSKLLKYIPFYGPEDVLFGMETGDAEIYRAWIEEQNQAAKETEIGSNSILQLLEGLIREHLQLMKGKTMAAQPEKDYADDVFILEHPDYGLRLIKSMPETFCAVCNKPATECKCGGERYMRSVIEFVATSAEVVDAFDRMCKNTGKRNPYESASVFIARLRNDRALLAKGGWELVTREGDETYFRIVRGRRFLKFRYTLVR